MTHLERLVLSVKVVARLLRIGQPRAALRYVLRPIVCPLRTTLITRPMGTLKLLRYVPGVVGAALLCHSITVSAASTLADIVLHAASALLGLVLLALSTALVLLPGLLWREYIGTWRVYGLRTLAFVSLLAVTAVLTPPAKLASALLVALTLWIGASGLVEHLIGCLLWQRRHRVAGSGATLGPDRQGLTRQQQHAVCTHEAGHLMMFGLLKRLPEDAFAMVDANPRFEFAGFVTPLQDIDLVDMSPALLRWHGMVALAGAAAEQLVVGHYSEGASADLDVSEKILRRLAALDYAQPFFRRAKSAGENALNAATVAALRVELFDNATRYLAANHVQLDRVAAHLAAHGSIDCLEFAPIWADSVTPPGFARIDPPAHIACLPERRPAAAP